MKIYKKLISIILSISILFTWISPISFADDETESISPNEYTQMFIEEYNQKVDEADLPSRKTYEYSPDKTSHTINWKKEGYSVGVNSQVVTVGMAVTGVYAPAAIPLAAALELVEEFGVPTNFLGIEPIQITVTETGLYSVTNEMGGMVPTNFLICARDSNNNLAPLPVATYGIDGNNEMALVDYNDTANRTTSVYLEAGKTYSIILLGSDAYGMSTGVTSITGGESPSESSFISINIEKIAVPENSQIYEVSNWSSLKFTTNALPKDTQATFALGESFHEIWFDRVQYSGIEKISGAEIDELLASGHVEPTEDTDSIEKLIAYLLVVIGDGFRSVISAVMGVDNITIDMLLFNEYSNTRLSIFGSSRGTELDKNAYLEQSGFLDSIDETTGERKEGVITKYFLLFRNIALVVYLVMLLYMGVRILYSSTGTNRAKYKSMLSNWVIGIVILLFFPYAIKYTIVVNNAVVDYIDYVKEETNVFDESSIPSIIGGISIQEAEAIGSANATLANDDIMMLMRNYAKGTGRIAYAIVYLMLIKELLTFVYIYFKRLLIVIFLIIIFPLVTISYAVDKIADGKSQAFNKWYSEFFLNVFLQTFQAINYFLIMSILYALPKGDGAVNVILMLVAFEYIAKGEVLLRSLFSKMSGGGAETAPKSLSEAAKTIATFTVGKNIAKSFKGIGKRASAVKDSAGNFRKKAYDYINARNDRYESRERLRQKDAENPNDPDTIAENAAIDDIAGNMNKILDDTSGLSDDEKKKVLDRLLVAMYDPKRNEAFMQEYNNLTPEQQEKLNRKLKANKAINETLAGNMGIRGILTDREININANLILNILEGKDAAGNPTTEYQELANYLKSHYLCDEKGNVMRDKGGDKITLASHLRQEARKRVITKHESRQLDNVQRMFGGANGIDVTTTGLDTGRNAPARVHATRFDGGESVIVNPSEVENIQRKYGNATATGKSAANQKRAAALVENMKQRVTVTRETDDKGRPRNVKTFKAMSPEEAMAFVREYRELMATGDADVKNILAQIGDKEEKKRQVILKKREELARVRKKDVSQISASEVTVDESEYALEVDVGFNMQQFEVMAALTVKNNAPNLNCTQEERKALVEEAGEILVEMRTGKRYEREHRVDAKGKVVTDKNKKAIEYITETDFDVDDGVQKLLQRAEMDDFFEEFSGRYSKAVGHAMPSEGMGFERYVVTKETQEQKRDKREREKVRRQAEQDYADMTREDTARKAGVELIKSGVQLAERTVQATVLAPVSGAMQMTAVALNTGLTGAYGPDILLKGEPARQMGAKLEGTIEKAGFGLINAGVNAATKPLARTEERPASEVNSQLVKAERNRRRIDRTISLYENGIYRP